MARVVLTQPLPRVEALARALSQRGHEVVCLPFTRVSPQSVDGLDDRLAAADWVVAVSPAAVEQLAAATEGRWPSRPGLALIGPGSLRALERSSLTVPPERVVHPPHPPFDAASLLKSAQFAQPSGQRMVVIRGDGGRDDWIDLLRSRGAQVDVLALYEREPVQPEAAARRRFAAWLAEPVELFCVFTQASAVEVLCRLAEAANLRDIERPVVALAIHHRIAEAARAAGFRHVRLIDPGEDAIAGAIE